MQELRQKIGEGEVDVPTELEVIMRAEALELVSRRYDLAEGREELYAILRRRELKGKAAKTLIEFTDLEKHYKLSRMPKTFEFIKSSNLALHYLELFFQIIITQTQNLVYLAMLFSMWQNTGIISFFYPCAVFGYALLEETRPGPTFWKIVRIYTSFVLCFKFILNLSAFDIGAIQKVQAITKIGIMNYTTLYDRTWYLMPEILIITLIMLNEIKLKLVGLYARNEDDVEPILDAVQRNIERGDEEAVKAKRLENSNMFMKRYFRSRRDQ